MPIYGIEYYLPKPKGLVERRRETQVKMSKNSERLRWLAQQMSDFSHIGRVKPRSMRDVQKLAQIAEQVFLEVKGRLSLDLALHNLVLEQIAAFTHMLVAAKRAFTPAPPPIALPAGQVMLALPPGDGFEGIDLSDQVWPYAIDCTEGEGDGHAQLV